MRQHIVDIDCSLIRDFGSFHDVFAAACGFPADYGRNIHAWIDCMGNPFSDWSRFAISDGDTVVLRLRHAGDLRTRLPDVFEALIDCTAFVNERSICAGETAPLALSWN